MELVFYMEMIGTVVFALQGSLVGIQRKLDILGIMILGLSTAVGGGMIRDIILGNTPPAMFINPVYCVVAALTVTGVILGYRYHHKIIGNRKYPYVKGTMHILDAIGLGIFTVVGSNISIQNGFGDNIFLCSFVGVMTGVGGGILRDVLANRTPVVLEKEIYAVASIIGAIFYWYMNRMMPHTAALYLSVLVIFIIRMVAVYKNMHLPAVHTNQIVEETIEI
ncbi:MAG: trimeric intracellular cation channel family protein [Cellulosilyticaceae bacterium]